LGQNGAETSFSIFFKLALQATLWDFNAKNLNTKFEQNNVPVVSQNNE
jgi:hypothetical protein